MVLLRLVVRSTLGSTFGPNFDSDSDFDSDAYFAIAPPETPISLRSILWVSLKVCIVVSFPDG